MALVILLGALAGAFATMYGHRFNASRERAIRSETLQREAYARFLGKAHELQLAITRIYREVPDATKRQNRLGELSPLEGQAALEDIRFVSAGEAVTRAETLWQHLRRHDIARGKGTGDYQTWKNDYWTLRKDLTAAVRHQVGPKPRTPRRQRPHTPTPTH